MGYVLSYTIVNIFVVKYPVSSGGKERSRECFIGTATSDMSGFYSIQWTPEHEGKYTIIATFEGSKSYYSSYAETAVGVDPAPATAGPIEPEPTEPAEAPLITTELAIIIAVVVVAVVGVVAFLMLRKQK